MVLHRRPPTTRSPILVETQPSKNSIRHVYIPTVFVTDYIHIIIFTRSGWVELYEYTTRKMFTPIRQNGRQFKRFETEARNVSVLYYDDGNDVRVCLIPLFNTFFPFKKMTR